MDTFAHAHMYIHITYTNIQSINKCKKMKNKQKTHKNQLVILKEFKFNLLRTPLYFYRRLSQLLLKLMSMGETCALTT